MQETTATLEAKELTIAEMSKLYGVSLRTLRFYEEKELLRPRRVGVQRFYCAKQRVQIELILTGRRLGFTLREIDELIRTNQALAAGSPLGLVDTLDRERIQQQIVSLESQRTDVEAALAELTARMESLPPQE